MVEDISYLLDSITLPPCAKLQFKKFHFEKYSRSSEIVSCFLFSAFDILWLYVMLIFVGRDGLTHNMLNDIHNHWKHAEAVRIKCLGVPTVDMKNICSHLEVSSFLLI